MREPSTLPWALILAGGEGARLRSLTTRISGDARPKQFCPLLDGETLLDRTRRRADLLARFDHHVIVVSRPHEAYYGYLAGKLAPGRLVVQPANRDTGPGILCALLRIADLAGDVPLAVLPSDHWVSDDLAFVGFVRSALGVVRAEPQAVVLLGVEASSAETDYGWIELASAPLMVEGEAVFRIRRFWEKPPRPLAEQLLARDCLWNTLVMVGWLSAFLELVEQAAPELATAFAPVWRALGSPQRESAAVERVYATLPAMSFSDRVLARAPERLAAMRVSGVEWSDWGDPERMVAGLLRAGCRIDWLDRWTAPRQGTAGRRGPTSRQPAKGHTMG